MLSYKKFCFGNMFSNTYLLWDEESREALIVDSGNEAEPILSYVRESGLTVKWVVLTHAHYDHVLYMDEYRIAFPDAKLMIGAGDAPLLSDIEGNVSYLFGDSRVFSKADEKLCDGEIIRLGEREIVVISTPGHTPGCICLYSREDKIMVTGDTLFGGGGIGRTDFKYGSMEILRESLKRLLSMDGDITILPGHGGASKIAYEQRSLFY
ncbi:MAG: MBL fold metallo-hydrolase [Clostridia bacterium]|nr:MBL fold metallo-hydrolase [Clostridia bacterium]